MPHRGQVSGHDREPHFHPVERSKLLRSFHHAIEGVLYTARTQPNLRVHFTIAVLVLLASLLLRLDRVYVAILVLTIGMVLALELLNTAVEAVVDLLTATHHPLAKTAKDAAAGAVFIAAIAAVVVGYLVFYQGIFVGGSRVFRAVAGVPANLVLVTLAVVAIGVVVLKARAGRGAALQGGAVSGHAALAFAGATLLALLYGTALGAVLAYGLALLVAQSRVEGGIHRPFEVLWGGVLGSLGALAIYLLARPFGVL
ncbi:MAG: diacylglycerol kinase [Vulcanimicrobiaceae bacterium]